MANPRN